jgi:hypothetical protein
MHRRLPLLSVIDAKRRSVVARLCAMQCVLSNTVRVHGWRAPFVQAGHGGFEEPRRRIDPFGDVWRLRRCDGVRSGVVGRVLPKAAIKLRP